MSSWSSHCTQEHCHAEPLSHSEGKLQCGSIQRHPIYLYALNFVATVWGKNHIRVMVRCYTFGHVVDHMCVYT